MPTATLPTGTNVVRLLPAQSRLYKLNRKYKGFIGGVGSGKTYFGGFWACEQALYTKGDGMIVAPTYRMLEDVTMPAFTERLDGCKRGYHHDISRSRIEVEDARVFMRSAEHPQRLRGPNLSWAWIDEAALARPEVWPIMMGRLRLNDARALITTTPAGFNWIHHYWIEMGRDTYGLIQASTRENKYLDTDFVRDLEDSYTSEFAAQEIDGEFVMFEGAVYSEFSHDSVLGNIRDFEVDPEWQKVRGIDFGYTNPFVCLFGAIDNDGRLYIYDEHYQRKTLIKDHARSINERVGDFIWTVADHDAQERAELNDAGISTQRAKKDVTIGIQKVKSRLKRQADGKPRLIVHPRCVQLIKEFGAYRWNPKRPEEPVKELDHGMDAMRYMVMEIDQGGFFIV